MQHFVTIVALLVAASASASADVGISLRSQAAVTGDVVRLSDIATLSGPAATVDRYAVVTIMPTPPRAGIADYTLVRSRLAAAGLWNEQVQLHGASRCRLTRQAAAVQRPTQVRQADVRAASQRLADAVEARLKAAFPNRRLTASVRLDAEDAMAILNAQRLPLTGGNADLSRPQELTVALPRPVRFTADIEETNAVLVAATSLPRGTVLTAGHLQFAAVDGGDVYTAESLLGRQLRRPLREGQPLRQQDVQAVILVRPGAIVSVSVQLPGLSITRQMKSRSEGGMGESIQCVSLDGTKTLSATVTGPNQASVGPPPPTSRLSDEAGMIEFRTAEEQP